MFQKRLSKQHPHLNLCILKYHSLQMRHMENLTVNTVHTVTAVAKLVYINFEHVCYIPKVNITCICNSVDIK